MASGCAMCNNCISRIWGDNYCSVDGEMIYPYEIKRSDCPLDKGVINNE